MSLNQPLLVVGDQPSLECMAQLLARVERPHPQELFFECTDKTLCDAIAFRCPDKS